jgi:lysyl endopeptidase
VKRFLAALLFTAACTANTDTVDVDEPVDETEMPAPVEAGPVHAYGVETAHPYAPGSWVETVRSPGAAFVRVHLTGLDLAAGDYVTVADPSGTPSYRYDGKGPHGDGDVWAFAIDGDTAIVELHAASRGHGFAIAEVGHGTLDLRKQGSGTPDVVCGTDGREDVACHTSDPLIDAIQRPVARLLFTSGGSQFLCTGELIAGANASTMITNNHCFSTQNEVNTVQALFDFQASTCGGPQQGGTSFAGGTFLKTSSSQKKGKRGGLDYTLLTLQGNPEATYGELVGTTKPSRVGDLIYFVQHPGGRAKEIGFYEDDAHTTRCKVDAIAQTYSTSALNSQTAYGCDSEGGSSGSAITDAITGHVVALHHFGGVSSAPCLNSGTQMSKICADAGSLLTCTTN